MSCGVMFMGVLLFPVFSSYASVYPTEVGLEEIFNIWGKGDGKTIALFVTPKFIDRFCDFSNPSSCIKIFMTILEISSLKEKKLSLFLR